MTQHEVVKAIRDNAESNATLGKLMQNRPLLVALSVLETPSGGSATAVAASLNRFRVPDCGGLPALHS